MVIFCKQICKDLLSSGTGKWRLKDDYLYKWFEQISRRWCHLLRSTRFYIKRKIILWNFSILKHFCLIYTFHEFSILTFMNILCIKVGKNLYLKLVCYTFRNWVLTSNIQSSYFLNPRFLMTKYKTAWERYNFVKHWNIRFK